MKILVFTEGTVLMHKNAKGLIREKIVEQSLNREKSVKKYFSYISIGNCVDKLKTWKLKGAKIFYLTSRKKINEIKYINNILKKFNFPNGKLLFRKDGETYSEVAERIIPDVLIEDDCESIGGVNEMTITNVKPLVKKKIKSIVVKEFEGIDSLPGNLRLLKTLK